MDNTNDSQSLLLTARKMLRRAVRSEKHPLFHNPASRSVLREIQRAFDGMNPGDLWILGTGGSSRGGEALTSALDLTGVEYLSTTDPHGLERWLNQSPSALALISKSGRTLEVHALRGVIERHFGALPTLVVTDEGPTPLRELANQKGWPVVNIPPQLGGRFSGCHAPGLVPLSWAGGRLESLCEGVSAARDEALLADFQESPPLQWANTLVQWMREGLDHWILLTYEERLVPFCAWLQQLLAESLGKEGRGPLPMTAQGPQDQHSLLQLWTQGPPNQGVILLEGPTPPGPGFDEEVLELSGIQRRVPIRLGEIHQSLREATMKSLEEAKVPVLRVGMKTLNEFEMGRHMHEWEWATVLLGEVFGLNPFGQPGVERGKILARERLSK